MPVPQHEIVPPIKISPEFLAWSAIYKMPKRLQREHTTVNLMIDRYCRDNHHAPILCEQCSRLQLYAETRLQRCRYQEDKPTCANCPTHCYNKPMKIQIKEVMRYSGPKMLWHHPILALRHILDGRKEILPRKQGN